ncbi:MAG: methylated-DNA--[protein]-cysteine S-methyltransferase [Legionella sp.]|nr:methylated-DNA--[protein]-cysteine S-methyltransferase [Legionella sp.]
MIQRNLFYTKLLSPVGELTMVASDQGLRAILWEDDKSQRVRLATLERDETHVVLVETQHQLKDYFAGKLQRFNLPLDFVGTTFQKQVWESLCCIPFGETRTYGQIAAQIGRPKAVRAVGAASGRNPISIIAPCHRVIGANGQLTGFAGGLEIKAYLLKLERQFHC